MITLLSISVFSILALVLAVELYRCHLKRSWRQKINLPQLTAYAKGESHRIEDLVQVCVHTTHPARATLLRLGETLEQIEWTAEVATCRQSPEYDRWRGFSWHANLQIDSAPLATGAYCLHLEHVGNAEVSYRVPLLIRSNTQPAVAVVASTNTWQAYNDFSGLSNYADRVTPWPLAWVKKVMGLLNVQLHLGDRHHFPSVPLPVGRPNDAINQDLQDLEACPIEKFSHLLRAEWSLLRFLERENVSYHLYSDRDLACDPEITTAQLLVFNTHSEYWSEEMIGRLQAYLLSGGQALFVSGNNQYRKVDLLEDSIVVCDFKTDAKQTSELIGVAYDARGYQSYGGYRVAAPGHWLFDGQNVAAGDRFAYSDESTHVPRGASGYETDKITAHSGDVTILAIGDNPEGPAYMVYKHLGRGAVLNTGSVASAPWVEKDPVLAGLVRRFIDHAIASGETKHDREAA